MANDDNRFIVEKYICHKLLKMGYAWDFENAEDEEDADINVSMPGLARRCHGANNARPGSVPHVSKRLSQPDPHAAIHRVLREAGDELERLYQTDFAEMSHQLYLTSSMAERRFKEVIDELFRDGVNWGRITAFFEFGGTICVECVNKEMTSQVDHIAGWMTEYLNGPLHSWIQENGGWEGASNIPLESRLPLKVAGCATYQREAQRGERDLQDYRTTDYSQPVCIFNM
uniref:BCL2 apoptosis regulator n=1 Tax=Hucho hucho TaxID=62062 RepID=A0A4W5NU21_9TELE